MEALSTHQYKAMLDVYHQLVERGFSLVDAARAVARSAAAVIRNGDAGLGKVIQTREIRHTGDIPAYPGGQCFRLDLPYGSEPYAQLQKYRDQGWSVTQIGPYSDAGYGRGKQIWYACPPGAVPPEHQGLVMQAVSE